MSPGIAFENKFKMGLGRQNEFKNITLQVFDEDSEESVDILSDDSYSQLRAEAIPQEDLDIEDGLDLNCCHVTLNDGRKVSLPQNSLTFSIEGTK